VSESARSRSYPAISLPEALEALSRQIEGLGSGARDRGEIAQALGYTSGSSGIAGRKISAVSQFGLVLNNHGLYEPTELAREILAEKDEDRLKEHRRTAFLNPSLFREIVEEYLPQGKVPRLLAHTLRDYRISANAREEVARIFMESALYARVLDTSGVFEKDFLVSARLPAQPQGQGEPSLQPVNSPLAGLNEQVIRLYLTDDKVGELRLPYRLNEQDLIILRSQLGVLEAQVQVNRPAAPLRWTPRQERNSG
jgi:hypothetical protein